MLERLCCIVGEDAARGRGHLGRREGDRVRVSISKCVLQRRAREGKGDKGGVRCRVFQ